MSISTTDYENDAIKGAQLLRLATAIATDIAAKQDIIDAEFDNANNMLVLNNVDIEIPSST